ncbi:MAG TPA: SDR family oxidoreductase [Usitatibacteraceae bacterium]|nr:SDR family oxidoreductase [Usitatibacteraceae bacterium]
MGRSRTVLIVGFGDIGRRVAARLRGRYRVVAWVRKWRHAGRMRGVEHVRGDLDRPHTLTHLDCNFDWIFHFAPPPEHRRDLRTRNLLARFAAERRSGMLTRGQPRRWVYVSTTGVYGDRAGAWVDENTTTRPGNPRAQRRGDAERQLLRWGRATGEPVAILRSPGIYSAERLPVERLRRALPVLRAQDDVVSNRIHADDLANVAILAARHARRGRVFNVVDDEPLPMAEYFDRVADAAGLPRPPRIDRQRAQREIGPMMLSFMSESRRIRNDRMKRELRVRLAYPRVEDFLARHFGASPASG